MESPVVPCGECENDVDLLSKKKDRIVHGRLMVKKDSEENNLVPAIPVRQLNASVLKIVGKNVPWRRLLNHLLI